MIASALRLSIILMKGVESDGSFEPDIRIPIQVSTPLRSLLVVKESISKRPSSTARCFVFLPLLCGDSVVPVWQE